VLLLGNLARTVLLLAGTIAAFAGIGALLGSPEVGGGLGVVAAVATYLFAGRLLLLMTRARPLTPIDAARVHALTIDLAARAGIRRSGDSAPVVHQPLSPRRPQCA
jgi:hypothetical protein